MRLSKVLFFVVQLLWIAFFLPSAQAQMEKLEKKYQTLYDLQVGAKYNAAVSALEAKYLTALQGALDTATARGQLDAAVALRAEIKRIEEKRDLSDEVVEADSDLGQLRAKYSEKMEELNQARALAAAPIVKEFGVVLQKLQDDLTKQKDLESALKVKAYRAADLGAKLHGSPIQEPNADQPDHENTNVLTLAKIEGKWFDGSAYWELQRDGTASWQPESGAKGTSGEISLIDTSTAKFTGKWHHGKSIVRLLLFSEDFTSFSEVVKDGNKGVPSKTYRRK